MGHDRMELRDIFSYDILGDRELLTVWTYCLREAQPIQSYPRYVGEVVELGPYEVLIEWERLARDVKMTKDQFIAVLGILRKMRRLEFRPDDNYCRVTVNILYPIRYASEVRQPGEDIITIKLDRWNELDVEQIVAKGFSVRYQEMVRQVLTRFTTVVGNKALMDLNVGDYREYVRSIKSGKAGNASVNNYRRVLVASLNRAIEGRFLKANFVAGEMPLPAIRYKPKIVEQDELKVLLGKIGSAAVRNVVAFALLSAKRHGEILNLKWSDIDFESKKIWIHSSDTYRVKFNKEQNLPLSEPLEAMLHQVLNEQRERGVESDYVFVDEGGRPLSLKKVQHVMKAAREAAGLANHVTIHALRRTAATRLKQNGVSINTIKGLLNHESEKTTNRYLGVPKEDEAVALNKLSISVYLPRKTPLDNGQEG